MSLVRLELPKLVQVWAKIRCRFQNIGKVLADSTGLILVIEQHSAENGSSKKTTLNCNNSQNFEKT